MGKASITGGGDDGLYTVDIEKNIATLQSRSTALQAQINSLETQILEAEAGRDALELQLDAQRAALDALITQLSAQEPGSELWKTVQKQVIAQSATVQTASKYYQIGVSMISRLRATKLALEQSQGKLDAEAQTESRADIWCADLTIDLSGYVATAEIPGQDKHVLIRPGWNNRANYLAARDGIINPSLSISPEALYWNWAMRPGWERWKPTYRGATLSALSGDTCTVTLDTTKSADQDLNVNPQPSYTGVTIEYMDCDGEAFENGDHVLVEFAGQDKTTPKVVGFYDNPMPCYSSEFVCRPASVESPDGWGRPFTVNLPLGTVGGTFSETLVKSTASKYHAAFREYDNYGGFYPPGTQFLWNNTYGFYDWIGEEKNDVLTIISEDGNRYFSRRKNRGTKIFFKGEVHSNTYNGQLVTGVGLTTISSIKYLYAIKLKPDGAQPIDEIFQVWRRKWQATPYANDNLYVAGTEEYGWELIVEINPPDYDANIYDVTKTYFPVDEDETDVFESGQIGGAAFSPNGQKFLLTYYLFRDGYPAEFHCACCTEFQINATGGIGTTTERWNPITNLATETTGWEYCFAYDYNTSNQLVGFYAEESYADFVGDDDRMVEIQIRLEASSQPIVSLVLRKFFKKTNIGYQLFLFNLDIRFNNLIGLYYAIDGQASTAKEQYGVCVVNEAAASWIPFIERNAAITPPDATELFAPGVVDPIGNPYSNVWNAMLFGIPILDDRPLNFAASDRSGNLLASVPRDWTELDNSFSWGPGAPTAMNNYNYLSGKTDVESFFSINNYTDPALIFISVI